MESRKKIYLWPQFLLDSGKEKSQPINTSPESGFSHGGVMAYRDDFREVQGEGRWTLPCVLLVFMVVMVAGFGFTFISDSFNFFSYKFWAPKQESVRRQTYEQTKSYRKGSVQR